MRPEEPAAPASPRLAFIVTEDWFFVSHFLPMARAAVELGFEVAVITRVRDHRTTIESVGARVIPLEAERSSLNPVAAGYAAGHLASILEAWRPDVVHCIALRSILVGGAACAIAGIDARVYALTGLGLIGARADAVGRVARSGIRFLLRGVLESRNTHYLFENKDDPRLLGLDPADASRVTIIGGAGVDPDRITAQPMPPAPPLRIAVVARMLWSKGIDNVVEAVRQARAGGAPIELSLYGAPDPSNRRAIPEAKLRAWSSEPGIAWHGPTSDVAAVWRQHHVCCLASRGGEGLPRTLLEGAAAGRAIVTTDVPGCRRLVRDGVEGLIVPPNDPAALAQAFTDLAKHPERVARFGEGARARVLDGFTERAVMDQVKALYRTILVGAGR
ncbi:MAG TPA: glycosyltransferase family 4 protein [Enterovirga sp.]|nr:glycosyltransferase family 4 protein [Enterovirga sp.]